MLSVPEEEKTVLFNACLPSFKTESSHDSAPTVPLGSTAPEMPPTRAVAVARDRAAARGQDVRFGGYRAAVFMQGEFQTCTTKSKTRSAQPTRAGALPEYFGLSWHAPESAQVFARHGWQHEGAGTTHEKTPESVEYLESPEGRRVAKHRPAEGLRLRVQERGFHRTVGIRAPTRKPRDYRPPRPRRARHSSRTLWFKQPQRRRG